MYSHRTPTFNIPKIPKIYQGQMCVQTLDLYKLYTSAHFYAAQDGGGKVEVMPIYRWQQVAFDLGIPHKEAFTLKMNYQQFLLPYDLRHKFEQSGNTLNNSSKKSKFLKRRKPLKSPKKHDFKRRYHQEMNLNDTSINSKIRNEYETVTGSNSIKIHSKLSENVVEVQKLKATENITINEEVPKDKLNVEQEEDEECELKIVSVESVFRDNGGSSKSTNSSFPQKNQSSDPKSPRILRKCPYPVNDLLATFESISESDFPSAMIRLQSRVSQDHDHDYASVASCYSVERRNTAAASPGSNGEVETLICEPEWLVEEDGSSLGVDRLRTRTSFTGDDIDLLKHHFQLNPWPDREETFAISQKVGHPVKVVNVWFRNARTKSRKEGTLSSVHIGDRPFKHQTCHKSFDRGTKIYSGDDDGLLLPNPVAICHVNDSEENIVSNENTLDPTSIFRVKRITELVELLKTEIREAVDITELKLLDSGLDEVLRARNGRLVKLQAEHRSIRR